MKSIYRLAISIAILLLAGVGALSLTSGPSAAQTAEGQKLNAPAAPQSQVERGRYLVQDVAMCSECHTPRDASGELDNSRYLQGASIWITPVHPTTTWGMRAPALAGFEGFSEEQGEQILEQGVGPNGLSIQPPMHIYHMNHADAQAIIAYLRSLSSAYPQQQ